MSQERAPSTRDGIGPDQHPLSALTQRSTRWVVVLVVSQLVLVEPVVAQQSAMCGAEKLPGMIEGFFQLSVGIGMLGLAVVWQADSLLEMVKLDQEGKRRLRDHRRSALKSAVVLVALGPLYTVAGSTMGLPLAECIDLVPW